MNSDLGFNGVITIGTQMLRRPETSGVGPNDRNMPGPDTRPIAHLNIHGTEDKVVPPEGGSSDKAGFAWRSVQESVQTYAGLGGNGCSKAPTTRAWNAKDQDNDKLYYLYW